MNREKREFWRQIQSTVKGIAGAGFLTGLALMVYPIFSPLEVNDNRVTALAFTLIWISFLVFQLVDGPMFEKFLNAFWPARGDVIDDEDTGAAPDMWVATSGNIRADRRPPLSIHVIMLVLLAAPIFFYVTQNGFLTVGFAAAVLLLSVGIRMLWQER